MLEAWATPPRFNESTVCNPPVIPNPPSALPRRRRLGRSMGLRRRRQFVGRNAAQHQQSYFQHAFCAAGVYQVNTTARTATATATLHAAGDRLPGAPATILLRDGRLIAHVHGGDGVPLYLQWTLASTIVGPQHCAPAAGR